jgi:hypothetical protein
MIPPVSQNVCSIGSSFTNERIPHGGSQIFLFAFITDNICHFEVSEIPRYMMMGHLLQSR